MKIDLCNLAININVFFYLKKYQLHSFDVKIPEFYQILSNMLSIMSLHSMIQTFAILYSTRRNKMFKTFFFKHYLYLNLTIQVTRYCVRRPIFFFHQFQPWSDLLLRKLCQCKNIMMKKKTVQIAVAWTFDLC